MPCGVVLAFLKSTTYSSYSNRSVCQSDSCIRVSSSRSWLAGSSALRCIAATVPHTMAAPSARWQDTVCQNAVQPYPHFRVGHSQAHAGMTSDSASEPTWDSQPTLTSAARGHTSRLYLDGISSQARAGRPLAAKTSRSDFENASHKAAVPPLGVS
jgi:hypothetical protein